MVANIHIKQQKRRIVSQKECETDLKLVLPLFFQAFYEAVELFKKEIGLTPPTARVRNYEATLLNSKILQCVQKYFPDNWCFGKYKRFILRLNGYRVLVKKLNKYNKPMNVKTKNTVAIGNQMQLSLFEDEDVSDPVLFFGYRINSIGEIISPKLVFIDEDQVKWQITMDDIVETPILPIISEEGSADVSLRKGRKAVNN